MKDAKALFSETRIRDVLGGEEIYKKTLIDKHHIFPAKYLKKQGLKRRDINQVANLCYLEYPTNIKISDKAPENYFLKLLEQCTEKDLYRHAIPQKFWKMQYTEFLEARRRLIAEILRKEIQKIIEK